MKAIKWDEKFRHYCIRSADHGIFDVETACNILIDIYGSDWGCTWEFIEVTCPECVKYIDKNYPLCFLCKTNRAHSKFCETCCKKHFEEQKAKYPGLNPLYYDLMPGENVTPSKEYLELKNKAKAKLGFK